MTSFIQDEIWTLTDLVYLVGYRSVVKKCRSQLCTKKVLTARTQQENEDLYIFHAKFEISVNNTLISAVYNANLSEKIVNWLELNSTMKTVSSLENFDWPYFWVRYAFWGAQKRAPINFGNELCVNLENATTSIWREKTRGKLSMALFFWRGHFPNRKIKRGGKTVFERAECVKYGFFHPNIAQQ